MAIVFRVGKKLPFRELLFNVHPFFLLPTAHLGGMYQNYLWEILDQLRLWRFI